MRGPKTIAEACAATEISDFEVCQLLWAYRALNWIYPVAKMASDATSQPEGVAEELPPTPVEPIPVDEAAAVVESYDEDAAAVDEDLEGLGMVLKDPLA